MNKNRWEGCCSQTYKFGYKRYQCESNDLSPFPVKTIPSLDSGTLLSFLFQKKLFLLAQIYPFPVLQTQFLELASNIPSPSSLHFHGFFLLVWISLIPLCPLLPNCQARVHQPRLYLLITNPQPSTALRQPRSSMETVPKPPVTPVASLRASYLS